MSVTLILTSLPSESMLYQVLCVLDQPEVTGVILVYDGHYHVGIELIVEKGLPFYRIVSDTDKPFFSALNESVQLATTPYVFFLDPCMTIGCLPMGKLIEEIELAECFAVGQSEGKVSFRKGLADWMGSDGVSWLSFESALVQKDRFLALGCFDPMYQWGEPGSVDLSLRAVAMGETWVLSSQMELERLSEDFWLQGMPSFDREQLELTQSFLLFWRVGPRWFSSMGVIHLCRVLMSCFFFQPKFLRALVRALYWRVKL